MTVTDNGQAPATTLAESSAMDYYGTHAYLDTMYEATAEGINDGEPFLCFRNTADTYWCMLTKIATYWPLITANDVPQWIVETYGGEWRGRYIDIGSRLFHLDKVVTTKVEWEARTLVSEADAVDIAAVLTEAQAEIERLARERATLVSEKAALVSELETSRHQVTTLSSEIAIARRRGDERLAARNEEIRQALIDEGERRDWCDELDVFLEEHGFEPRTRDYTVDVTITFTYSYSVNARDEDDARNRVDNEFNTSMRADPFGDGGTYVDLEYEVDSIEAD